MIVQGNMIGQRYADHIVRPVVIPLAHCEGPHRADVAVDCLKGVTTLPWTTTSQDMSPSEHLLDVLRRRVRNRPQRIKNLQQLV